MLPLESAPALPAIVAARVLLDDALVATRTITSTAVVIESAADALSDAQREVYVALASTADARTFIEARNHAAEHVRSALKHLQTGDDADPALDAVTLGAAQALRLLVSAWPPVLDPSPLLPRVEQWRPPACVTLVEPQLLDLRRDVLRPSVPIASRTESVPATPTPDTPTLAPVADLAALRAETLAALRALDAADEAPPAEKRPHPPAALPEFDLERAERAVFGEQLTPTDVLFERARGCLEDLGALGLARRPMQDEPWWCPRTEARLLTRIDALAACGESVLPWLVKLLAERPVPDPELTWALVLFFACMAGDDAIDQAMRLARITPTEDVELREALADAFTHAPHPKVPERLAAWLDDATPGRREVALVALGRRGLLSPDTVAPLVRDPDARIASHALLALAGQTDDLPPSVLSRALARSEDSVLCAALDLAVRHAPELALWRANELVKAGDADLGDAGMHVAIGAGEEGLANLLAGEASAVRCEAVGWYGHVDGVAWLVRALESGDEVTVAHAAHALWRITGAPLTKDEPEPELNPLPFTGATWEDNDLPECPEELSVAPAPWSQWWKKYGAKVDRTKRWRYGRRWRVEDNVRVLAAKTSRPRDRRWAALELVARTGKRLPFEAWRFIPRQLEQIAAWHEAARQRTSYGPWPVAPGGAR